VCFWGVIMDAITRLRRYAANARTLPQARTHARQGLPITVP
jgi:hypothetical protein